MQYARWSDPSQGKGNSKARQFGKMREEAARQGYVCEMEVFDDGRSAFHGHHITKGKLGELLAEIDVGRYIGWVIQVENIDRLSRQGHEAVLDLVRRITAAGVSIHTCDGDHLKGYEPVTLQQVIILSVKADLANKESEKRSDRASCSWSLRRAKAFGGKAIPGAGPTWVKRVGDQNVLLPTFAAQARRIWEIADETGHGAHTITRLLNAEGTPMFDTGKPWYQSRVDAILSGMEVIGYHQPRRKEGSKWVSHGEPIKVYQPIIPHDLYARVRAAAAVRLATHGGGKSERIANLLSGICRCTECGLSMRLAGSSNGGYLMCSGRDRGMCANGKAFRYRPFEDTILREFLYLALDDNAFSNKSEITRLNGTIAEREIAHQVAIEKAKGLLNLAAKGSEMAVEMALNAERDANEIEANIGKLRQQRDAAKGRADAAEHIARVKDVRDRLGHDLNLRRKVLQAFNMIIERVSFDGSGVASVRFIGGIIEVKIAQDGEVIEGRADLTLNDRFFADPSDTKVVAIAKQVTTRFAASFEKGEANWALGSAVGR